jgi:hypothetical protein
MLLWGFWVLAALQSPTSSSAHLAFGLAVVAAALLVVAAAGLPVLPPVRSTAPGHAERRARTKHVPRVLDPDAAGRPRPRAPSAYPAA